MAVSSVVALLMGASFDAGAVPFATISGEVLAWRSDISGIDDVASSAVGLTEGAFGLSAITLTGGEGGPTSLGLKVRWSACDWWFGRADIGRKWAGRHFVAGAASCTDRLSKPTYQHLRFVAQSSRYHQCFPGGD